MSADKPSSLPKARKRSSALSYKFQRLREQLRAAVASGELTGKLPGERVLARRFHVNAKTLSKALTDLAAEGLLDRSIGRGTYVKGSAPLTSFTGRWLLVCDEDQVQLPIVQRLLKANPEAQVVCNVATARPSFVNQFSAVFDFAPATPDAFLRDLVIRNIPVIAVDREPRTYSVHAVLLDQVLGVSCLGRDLLLAGHRHLVAVERRNHKTVSQTLRNVAARYAPEAEIDTCFASEIEAAVSHGATGIVCDCIQSAREVRHALQYMKIEVPAHISVAAVGVAGDNYPCSGFYADCGQIMDAIQQILLQTSVCRPVTLWLAGRFVDRSTIGPARMIPTPPHPKGTRPVAVA